MIDDRTDLEKDYDNLAARLAEAERDANDAARYRWLRDTASTADRRLIAPLTAEQMDAEIDSGRAADSAKVVQK